MADADNIQVITYDEPRIAPLRAIRQYYHGAFNTGEEATGDGASYLISAYLASNVIAPSIARLYYEGMAEDGDSETPETPADPSTVVGRYRPAVFRLERSYYAGMAHDEDMPAVEAQNPSMVVGRGYHRTIYLPYEFHRFMIGDEGVVVEPCINPRGKAGAPTVAGLARYATGENCTPRAGAGSDSCEER